MPSIYKLEELAAEAGVSPRTVRYYVQRGLLAAPEFRGKDTAYGREHLLRLHAIKRLQEARLALDEIQERLAGATEAELVRLATASVAVAPRRPFEEPRDTQSGEKRRGSQPAPPVFPLDPRATAHVYRLATGVELWVRGSAPAASHALVREILDRYATTTDDKDEGQ